MTTELLMGRRTAACLAALLLAVSPLLLAASAPPSRDDVVQQIKKAVEYYKAHGREASLVEFNRKDGQFAQGEDYVDVHDVAGTCVAHPITPGIVGLNRLEQADSNGKQFIKEIVTAAKTKPNGWITYERKNPLTGKIETKLAYWQTYDGLIFKAGTYQAH